MKNLLPFCLVLIAVIVEVRSTVIDGKKSGGNDDAVSVATCPKGTVGLKCSCSPANQCDGSYFTDDVTCKAFHRAGFTSSSSIAHVTCSPLLVRKMSAVYGVGPKESCDPGFKLVDCQVYTPWAQSYPKYMSPVVSGNTCAASSGCKKCKVQVVCVKQV